MPSSRPTSNPFDSDDDTHSNNPFDDPKPIRGSKPTSKPAPSSSRPVDPPHNDLGPSSASPLKPSVTPHQEKSIFNDNKSEQRVKFSRDSATGARERVRRTKGTSPNLFKKSGDINDIQGREELLAGASHGTASGTRYDDAQFRKQDLEYKSVEELEGYAVQKSKETTSTIQSCLKVAEEIRGDATQTLVTLVQQGDQIRRTHEVAVEIDQNLTRGETFLGNLGGMFSRTWKPKKTRQITGPALVKIDSFKRRGNHLEQRAGLGLHKTKSKGRTRDPISHANSGGTQTTQEVIDIERLKQDDALSDLSNVLAELKGMSLDMGKEIASQNVYLDDLDKDVTTLNERVAGANQRARHLLRK